MYNLEQSNDKPISQICSAETEHLINCFCTLVVFYYNKKMSYANIFLLLLKEKKIRKLYKQIIDEDDDQKALKLFLNHEPGICKSKFISKFLNNKVKSIRI